MVSMGSETAGREIAELLREILQEMRDMNAKLDKGLALADNPLVKGVGKVKNIFSEGLPKYGN